MICSSEKRFFTSNLLGIGNWTPNQGATQTWGDVAATPVFSVGADAMCVRKMMRSLAHKLIALSARFGLSLLIAKLAQDPRRDLS
ncbi:hypothetical protein EBA02_14275 [Xanthomonas oryzae pv. oryzae]|nr:hypothetical protein EYR02_09690 [Xanthomonas oryzae pv. oryzae]QBI15907.1 hypothetical protein EYR03_10040 [Xanthomonas oryzae pv. oryzae]QBN25223.1 hypothetical protein EBA00_12835 [Xanthomonas oryzae pv. oryzae]QBN32645.1 hypothetical protein EBA02_14275 [Xanthomonas oryzae pv. oryzae]QBN58473.1 hypothetical protein EBA09_16910 [Xanthomonas oryzae pv. oryzae]